MWTAELAAVFDDVVNGLLVMFDLLVFEVAQEQRVYVSEQRQPAGRC